MGHVDATANRLAAASRGSVTRGALVAAGISTRSIRRRLASGAWEERVPEVIDLPGHAETWERAVLRLALSCDGWASHATAAHLLDLKHAPRPPRIEVVQLRGQHPEARTPRPHETTWLPPEDTTRVAGVPCLAAARTIVDTAWDAGFEATLDRLHDAVRRGLCLPEDVRRVIEERRRLPGVDIVRRALDALHPQAARLESGLETDGLGFLRRHGFPEPTLQVPIWHRGRFVARPDAVYAAILLAMEWDSATHHLAPSELRHDRERDARLAAAGWEVFHVPTASLRPAEAAWTAARLARTMARRVEELGVDVTRYGLFWPPHATPTAAAASVRRNAARWGRHT